MGSHILELSTIPAAKTECGMVIASPPFMWGVWNLLEIQAKGAKTQALALFHPPGQANWILGL